MREFTQRPAHTQMHMKNKHTDTVTPEELPAADTVTPEELPAADTVTPEEINALLDAQGNVIAEQQGEIEALRSKVENLLAAMPGTKPGPRRGSFTLDGQEYAILHGIQLSDGSMLRTLTPADIEREEDIQRELVALGSGAIKLIV